MAGPHHGHGAHLPDGYFSTLISGPNAPILTTAEAKAQLRVDFTDDDDLIDAYIAAANDMMDAEHGELGRALVTQRWQATLSAFPNDADNTLQTIASDQYRLTINSDRAVMDFIESADIPSTFSRDDAVMVQYDAGYGDNGTDVPEGIRTAARLMIGLWYDQRTAANEASMSVMPVGIKMLLNKFRVARGFI